MKTFSVMDIIGPRMVGPSSSHTAGAVRIGLIANKLVNGHVAKASITLYGSFAKTGRGHGTDRAIIAGILGVAPDDERIKYSMLLAKSENIEVNVKYSAEDVDHPNTARVEVTGLNGSVFTLVGVSIGGGNIEIREINGMSVLFSGDYPTIIVFYQDTQGIISRVTRILSEAKINVAFMKVFRSAKRQNACMVIETDSIVTDELLRDMLVEIEEIKEVCSI